MKPTFRCLKKALISLLFFFQTLEFKIEIVSDFVERWTLITRQRFAENQLDFLLKRDSDGSIEACCQISPKISKGAEIDHSWLNFLWMPKIVEFGPILVEKEIVFDQYLIERGIAPFR